MLCLNVKQDYKFKIILLDDREYKFTYKGYQKCQCMLNDIAKLINLVEKEYFSFRFVNAELQSVWIDLAKTIQSQFKSILIEDNEIVVYFNVKYYIADPCKLNHELTRYLFYLQLRKDILHDRLTSIQFDFAVDLFSYFLQDELADYNPKRDMRGYASEFQFMRIQSIELEKSAEAKHMKLKGMSQENAEINFLNKVKWLDMYGVDSYKVEGEDGSEYEIQLNPTGISVYNNNLKTNSYFWPRIKRLDLKSNKLMLNVIDKTGDLKTHAFLLKTKSECKHLWKTCVDQHKFFNLKTVYDEPAKLSTTSTKSKKITISNSDVLNNNRINFRRIPAKRIPRRPDEIVLSCENNVGKEKCPAAAASEIIQELISETGGLIFREKTENEKFKDASSVSPIQLQKNYSRRRRESAESIKDNGLKKKQGRSRRSNSGLDDRNHQPDSDTDNNNENQVLVDQNNKEPTNRSSSASRRRNHRSNSRSSNKFPNDADNDNQWKKSAQLKHHSEAKIVKSKKSFNELNGHQNDNFGTNKAKQAVYNEHETSLDEDNDPNDAEKKRQIRRRKRSKSPGGTHKPPEEILQHINYHLVETNGFSADQLREIPFVKVETSAPPFRISPHQKQRRYSPHRRKSTEMQDSKSSLAYVRDGTAQVVKTTSKKTIDRGDYVMVNMATAQTTVSMGSAVNSKLTSTYCEPVVNVGFSADSGCEEMNAGHV